MTARFVILTHDHPHLHWDLMLEDESVLRTWRLSKPPLDSTMIEAEELPAHRKHYLDYEGPVSGGRGTVTRWDEGTYQLEDDTENHLRVIFSGKKLQTQATLTRDTETDLWKFQSTEIEESNS